MKTEKKTSNICPNILNVDIDFGGTAIALQP